MNRITILAVAAVVLSTAPAFAQPASPPGPGLNPYHRRPTPIGEILRNPRIDHVVTIRGRVTMSRGAWFILDDRTGRIRVDAKPQWRRPLMVREGETVTVTGKVVFGSRWGRTPAVAIAAYMVQRSDELMLRLRPYIKPQFVQY